MGQTQSKKGNPAQSQKPTTSLPLNKSCGHCSEKCNSSLICERCKLVWYCSKTCAVEHKSTHQQHCDISFSRTWHSLNESVLSQRNLCTDTNYAHTHMQCLWLPQEPNWNEILYPTEQDLQKYMRRIHKLNTHRDTAILSSYQHTRFPEQVCQIIIRYLPVFAFNETLQFAEEYKDDRYNLSLDHYLSGFTEQDDEDRIKKRMDWGTGIMNRFLMATNLITTQQAIATDMNIGIRERLLTWIETVYWYRLGPEVMITGGRKPADVLGLLKNGKYFYYKDGHPDDFSQYGITHDKYFYLIADDIESLFKQMDKRDIEFFLRRKKVWKPLEKKRSNVH